MNPFNTTTRNLSYKPLVSIIATRMRVLILNTYNTIPTADDITEFVSPTFTYSTSHILLVTSFAQNNTLTLKLNRLRFSTSTNLT